jgi:hypothetical protein
MDEVTTPETLPDAAQLTAADGGGADQPSGISLSQLKDVLGKDFKDVDGALKSIKDTYSFVGSQAQYQEKIAKLATALNTDEQGALSTIEKLMEDIKTQEGAVTQPAAQAPTGDFITREEAFFEKNEDLTSHRDVLNRLKNSGDDTKAMSWDQFISSDVAKAVIDPIRTVRDMESKKSVLDASPRLGAASDKMSQARQLVDEAAKAERSGDVSSASRAQLAASENAVAGVIEAFDLR